MNKKAIASVLLMALILSSCQLPGNSDNTGSESSSSSSSSEVQKYTVLWKDHDGTVLEVDYNVLKGTMPSYDGPAPTRDGGDEFTYTFNGWTPNLMPVTSNISYIATYTKITNEYKITWKNYDGTILKEDNFAYGSMPVYSGVTPTKDETLYNTYTFTGWSPNVVVVTESATYVAQFSENAITHVITWKNYDGTVLHTDNLSYGAIPVYSKETPTRTGNAEYTYAFTGWSPNIIAVTGSATYTAQFSQTVNTYTIIWKNYDGTILETDLKVPYGAEPSYDKETPSKEGDAEYHYEFTGWSPSVATVTGNATYVAQFSQIKNTYNVIWKNFDGSILHEGAFEYGTEPIYEGDTPKRNDDHQFSYSFNGWDGVPEVVNQDLTINAKYKATTLPGLTFIDKYTQFKDSISEVMISGLTSYITESAFSGCSSLTSIVIPNSINSIGEGAFSGCSALKSITLPFVGSKIGAPDGSSYFGYIFGIDSYIGGVRTDQNGLIYYIPSSLKEVKITKGTSIGKYAFSGCSLLTSIEIPDTVISIDDYLFNNCSSLTSVIIPSNVTSIGSFAFYKCSSLPSILIPDTVSIINTHAFNGCISLTSIEIPDSVTEIGHNAFSDCVNLTSVVIPSSVEKIGGATFRYCASLETLTIPFVGNSATTKGDNSSFGYIFGTTSFPGGIPTIHNGITYYIPSSLKEVIITGGTSIEDGAFYNCSSLTSIILPDTLVDIGDNAFRNCSSLTSLVIPQSVQNIGAYAFYGCTNIAIYLEIPNVPFEWAENWNYFNYPIYCLGEWEYIDGVPTPIQ